MEDKIDFGIHIKDGKRNLMIASNYTGDGDDTFSKEAMTLEQQFFVQLSYDDDTIEGERFSGLTIEDAELIISELTKAVAFAKEIKAKYE